MIKDYGTSWVFVYFDDLFVLFRIFSLTKKSNTKMQFKNPVMWTFEVWLPFILLIICEKNYINSVGDLKCMLIKTVFSNHSSGLTFVHARKDFWYMVLLKLKLVVFTEFFPCGIRDELFTVVLRN